MPYQQHDATETGCCEEAALPRDAPAWTNPCEVRGNRGRWRASIAGRVDRCVRGGKHCRRERSADS